MNRKDGKTHADFENIYLAYFSKMKHFAKVYVLSDEEAENIVQDVFTELWEKREMLTMPVDLIAYLFTSIKNKCLNFLRHQAVRREATDRIQEAHRLAFQAGLNSLEMFNDDVFSENEMSEVLEKALNTLSDKCRRIFVMSKMEGKKQKDIAAELNISVNTVETQMGIAYKKLKIELKDYLPLLLFLLYL
jgi:RNA polymerase sigma-70 factor (ECF subfamily)